MRATSALAGWVAVFLATSIAAAEGPGETPGAPLLSARLVAENAALAPGADNWIALHLDVIDGWHVYWRNPGDSGTPPRIDWRLPAGVAASEIVWPAPQRFVSGPLASYGYADEVHLPLRITIDPALAASTARLEASVKVLVCRVECIPQSAEPTLELPVREGSPRSGPAADAIRAALAAVPRPAPGWSAEIVEQDGESIALRAHPASGFEAGRFEYAFFPYDGGLVEPAAEQTVTLGGGSVTLRLRKSAIALEPIEELRGVLLATPAGENAPPLPFDLEARAGATKSPPPSAPASAGTWAAIGFAFVGGVLLNLMPCVFPVLAIKVLGFVRGAGEGRGRALAHGVAFAAGIVASFWVLAAGLLLLRAGGAEIGWGFQLQSPVFVLAMAFLFFGVALAFLGVLEVGAGLTAAAGAVRLPSGFGGSFASGVLATVVATPCTAPFMGTALGWALAAPTLAAVAVFTALGLGMGLPYVVLTASPRLLRALPGPGPWMETLKQFLAFPMLATVVWLLWVFGRQAGAGAQILAVGGLLVAGFGCWIAGRFATPAASAARRRAAAVAALLAVLGGFALALPTGPDTVASEGRAEERAGGIDWVPYSEQRLAELRAAGRPVYLDFTAAWCLTCQVNKRIVFGSSEVREAFRRHDVVAMRADWTNHDPEITRALAAFGRSGVPLNVLYGDEPGEEPAVLSTVLTPSIVLRAIETHLGAQARGERS